MNSKTIDEVPLPSTSATTLSASGKDFRLVGQYDAAHDTIQFLRYGDELGSKKEGAKQFFDAAPRHQFGDTKHHFVNYTAVATSRFREYFDPTADLDFTRSSEPVPVHVPASARPLAPLVRYVIPTFGWQREASTNVKRSIRFGGGLRVYLDRPWYSSGADERLAVVTAPNGLNLTDDVREEWKALITQWGQDPIWKTAPLPAGSGAVEFPRRGQSRVRSCRLDERQAAVAGGGPGNVDVAAFKVDYDEARKMWYCDLTVDVPNPTYGAFIRLALARYQPYALKAGEAFTRGARRFRAAHARSRGSCVSRSLRTANAACDCFRRCPARTGAVLAGRAATAGCCAPADQDQRAGGKAPDGFRWQPRLGSTRCRPKRR